jgi:uncharacterized protein (TIGR00299 family) protein
MTRIAILDPMSGIAGDMCLGALLDLGLPESFVRDLPTALGIADIGVQISNVSRGQIACKKVDFTIPPQPHGRHLKHIKAIVAATTAPESVKEKAIRCFTLITECEAAIHGTTVERVHLHEVGSVDAILDIVGTIWGLETLGVERVYCGTIPLGDGFVDTQHGRMAVPTAATLRLLEGLRVSTGPDGSGELVTPTGAALVRVLSEGLPPAEYTPSKSGFGAGTKDFPNRANALRIVLATANDGAAALKCVAHDMVCVVSADVDDATGEELAAVAQSLRDAGALDVVLIPVLMKKGRPGTRIEALTGPADSDAIAERLLQDSTSIGVRTQMVFRQMLSRELVTVSVDGHEVRLKVVTLPDGTERSKPEADDVQRVAQLLNRPVREIAERARAAQVPKPH